MDSMFLTLVSHSLTGACVLVVVMCVLRAFGMFKGIALELGAVLAVVALFLPLLGYIIGLVSLVACAIDEVKGV